METLDQQKIRILKNKIRHEAKEKMKIEILTELQKVHDNGLDVYGYVFYVRPKDKDC